MAEDKYMKLMSQSEIIHPENFGFEKKDEITPGRNDETQQKADENERKSIPHPDNTTEGEEKKEPAQEETQREEEKKEEQSKTDNQEEEEKEEQKKKEEKRGGQQEEEQEKEQEEEEEEEEEENREALPEDLLPASKKTILSKWIFLR